MRRNEPSVGGSVEALALPEALGQRLTGERAALAVFLPRRTGDVSADDALHENRFCPAWRESRLSVRPGMTGLWQLERTREPGEDFQEWIRYDIEYVKRAGLWLDLAILARTAKIFIFGRRQRAAE